MGAVRTFCPVDTTDSVTTMSMHERESELTETQTDEVQTIETPVKPVPEPMEGFTDNALHNILPERYLVRDDDGNVIEEPEELFERVARNVAKAELDHGDESDYEAWADEFQHLMETQQFMPNSPTLMNAGTDLQQLSACFVISPDDDMDSIFETANEAALIFKSGGGIGYSFSNLRPKGTIVSSTGGESSGPVSFMEVFNTTCGTVEQGGKRRGAQMGILRVDHADVGRFACAKRNEGDLDNFNISVAVTDEFVAAVHNNAQYTFYDPQTDYEEPFEVVEATANFFNPEYENNPADWEDAEREGVSGKLVDENLWRDYADDIEAYDPAQGETVPLADKWKGDDRIRLEEGEVMELPARFIMDILIDGAWRNGEPGLFAVDESNREHSFDVEEYPEHAMQTTNPCGEQMLENYEACNLGHINLSLMVADDAVTFDEWARQQDGIEFTDVESKVEMYLEENLDWDRFDHVIEAGTRFLDDVVTMSEFPLDDITEKVTGQRKIGLGIMGFAQMLFQLGIEYGSKTSYQVARHVMRHIDRQSKLTSHELAKERGTFEYWDESKYANPTEYPEWFEDHVYEDPADWADGFPIRNHNTTTIAPTGCVSDDSLISTGSGLTEINEMGSVPGYDKWDDIDAEVVTDDGMMDATAFYNAGLTDVKTITTSHGLEVSATPDHRLRTLDENGNLVWKEAREFAEGDVLVGLRNTFTESDPASLDVSERANFHHNTDGSLTLPETMTPELAEFLGYYMGNGYVHENVGVKLAVGTHDQEVIDHLTELSESVFGVEPTIEERQTRVLMSVGGRHLPRYFEDNGWTKEKGNSGEGAASAFVPPEVRRSTEPIARAFLRGLFEADGSTSRKVEFSTVSETLAKQTQTLLLALGHLFVRRHMPVEELGDGHYGDRDRYDLRGANKREDKLFIDDVGTISGAPDIELTHHSYRNDVFPHRFVDDMFDGTKGNKSDEFGDYVRTTQEVREAERAVVADGGRPCSDYVFGTVESVEDNMAYTKDLTVPDNNTYVANGLISHNTTSMLGNTTGGCEPLYNVVNYKNVGDDIQGDDMLVEFDDYFGQVLAANGYDPEAVKAEAKELMADNAFEGPHDLSIPEKIADIFVMTQDLSARQHTLMQRAFQEFVDAGLSKTVNMPNEAGRDDVYETYMLALKSGEHTVGAPSKGITVYRDGSREEQVKTTRRDNKLDETDEELHQQLEDLYEAGVLGDEVAGVLGLADAESKELCGECGTVMEDDGEGCSVCPNCYHSPCS